jgi:hypothetical protein
VDIPNTFNSVLFATRQPTEFQDLMANFEQLFVDETAHPLLIHAIQTTLVNIQPVPEGTVVFTDDRAPIEWLTNNLVLSFLFSGGAESLR